MSCPDLRNHLWGLTYSQTDEQWARICFTRMNGGKVAPLSRNEKHAFKTINEKRSKVNFHSRMSAISMNGDMAVRKIFSQKGKTEGRALFLTSPASLNTCLTFPLLCRTISFLHLRTQLRCSLLHEAFPDHQMPLSCLIISPWRFLSSLYKLAGSLIFRINCQ